MNQLILLLAIFAWGYGVMAIGAVTFVQRVNWTQSLIWPYYFYSDLFSDGFEKRPLS